MIREAFSNSKDDMETRLSGRMHTSLHEVGTEVAQERDARQLEEHPGAKKMPSKWDEEVDKSAVVIGGFADDVLQQAEETARVLVSNMWRLPVPTPILPLQGSIPQCMSWNLPTTNAGSDDHEPLQDFAASKLIYDWVGRALTKRSGG